METFGGTCCNNSFIRGTKLTGFPAPTPPPPLLPFFCKDEELLPLLPEVDAVEGGSGRPEGVANGGADKIDVNDGAEAASEDIFGLFS